MWNELLQWDRETFIYLNSLGIESYDGFWSVVTEIHTWIPLFLFFIFLFFWKFSRKEALFSVLTVILLALFITLITHWTKVAVGRLRPNNDLEINALIRILKTPTDFSFFSGHASSSFSITVLVFLFLRKKWKWSVLFFIWPILFCLSRIYVGVHYPLDIIVGALVGTGSAFFFYFSYQRFFYPKR
jgi:undecaprenyl-diphosphatase